MRNYEALLLLDPSLSAESVNDGLNKFEEILKKRKGSIQQRIERGKKKLGYEIKKKKDAIVYTVLFELDPAKLREVEFDLRLVPEVSRFRMFSLDSKNRFPGNLTAVEIGTQEKVGVQAEEKPEMNEVIEEEQKETE